MDQQGLAFDQQWWTSNGIARTSSGLARISNGPARTSKNQQGLAMDQQWTSKDQQWTSNGQARTSSGLARTSKDLQWTGKDQQGLARTSNGLASISNGPASIEQQWTSNDLLLSAWVLQLAGILSMLVARVFKCYRLKPIQCHTVSVDQVLKPMSLCDMRTGGHMHSIGLTRTCSYSHGF